MRPERRSILPHPPALGFDLAGGHRHLQFVLWPMLRTIFRAIHAREMLADDLIRLIALQALGPGIPTHDVSRRIEHENGLVLHPLNQQAEARLVLPQRGLHPLALAAALHVAQFAFERRDQPGQFPLLDVVLRPPFISETARFRSISPDTMRKGTSGQTSLASARAAGALKCGIAWSEVITSQSWRARAARMAAGVSTTS